MKRGNLVLARYRGQAIRIGRFVLLKIVDVLSDGAVVFGVVENGAERRMTRRLGETIRIEHGKTWVMVSVVEVHLRGSIKVAIQAPPDVAVSRDDFSEEDHLRVQAEREAS